MSENTTVVEIPHKTRRLGTLVLASVVVAAFVGYNIIKGKAEMHPVNVETVER